MESKGEPDCKTPINRAAVEHKAQQLRIEVFASNSTWDTWGMLVGLFLVLVPIRDRLQALARARNWRAFKRLVDRQFSEVGEDPKWRSHLARLAWYYQRVRGHAVQQQSEHRFTLLQELPEKKIAAFDEIVTLLTPSLTGSPITDDPRKQLRKLLSAVGMLTAASAGRKPLGVLDAAQQLYGSARKYQVLGGIQRLCKELARRARSGELRVSPDDEILRYSDDDLSPDRRHRVEQRIRSAINRRKKKQTK
jgi:hypothetical protein